MPALFDELKLRSITLRNRIGISPMCQYSSIDGHATDWHLMHLGARAAGGAGLIIAEATGVSPAGRITPGCAGLWNDDQIEPLARINRFVKSCGAVIGIQLAHAGRKASVTRPWDGDRSLTPEEGAWETLGPSPLAFGGKITHTPREMTKDDIARVTAEFVAATKRAVAAGYQWLELHSAHGYLLHSFLSPIANQRRDEYGGSFENRTRFTIDTARAMRSVWPDQLPMSVRLSCTDWSDDGWTLEESVELSKRLKAVGIDLIDCSSGFVAPGMQRYPIGAGWQVPLAEAVRRGAEIPTAAVGLITAPAQADEIIRNGRADLVLLARESLRRPHWPIEAAQVLGKSDRIKLPAPHGFWVS